MKSLFRFHLSTLVAVSFMAGGAIYCMLRFDSDCNKVLFCCRGEPLPWQLHVKDGGPVGTVYHHRICGHMFQIEYAAKTDISYLMLAIDCAFWLLVMLSGGTLFEWALRRVGRKPTSTKP